MGFINPKSSGCHYHFAVNIVCLFVRVRCRQMGLWIGFAFSVCSIFKFLPPNLGTKIAEK